MPDAGREYFEEDRFVSHECALFPERVKEHPDLRELGLSNSE